MKSQRPDPQKAAVLAILSEGQRNVLALYALDRFECIVFGAPDSDKPDPGYLRINAGPDPIGTKLVARLDLRDSPEIWLKRLKDAELIP